MVEATLISFLVVNSLASSGLAARQVLAARSVEGLAGETQLAIFLTSAAWGLYGYLHGTPAQALCGVAGAASALAVIGVGLRVKQFRIGRLSLLTFVFAATIAALALHLHSDALALVSTLVMFVARLPEVVEAWKRPGGEGVSVSGFATLAVTSAGWTAFGLMQGDMWIFGASLHAMLQSVYMVVRTLQGRSKMPTYTIETAPTLVMPRIQAEAA